MQFEIRHKLFKLDSRFYIFVMQIKKLRRLDYKTAIQYAIKGMHLDWYVKNKTLLDLYGRYFWYLELNRATQIIAAYEGDTLAGILLADIKGEDKLRYSPLRVPFIKIVDLIQHVLSLDKSYNDANAKLLKQCSDSSKVDGEIIFLAVNPELQGKGTGSLLLTELERRAKGKCLILYTDDGCNYQFYEHKGFRKAGEETIRYSDFSLRCFLYEKYIS